MFRAARAKTRLWAWTWVAEEVPCHVTRSNRSWEMRLDPNSGKHASFLRETEVGEDILIQNIANLIFYLRLRFPWRAQGSSPWNRGLGFGCSRYTAGKENRGEWRFADKERHCWAQLGNGQCQKVSVQLTERRWQQSGWFCGVLSRPKYIIFIKLKQIFNHHLSRAVILLKSKNLNPNFSIYLD